MSTVTDADRAEARALWGHCMDHEGEEGAVGAIAKALAEERAKARAPFLALAEEYAADDSRISRSTMAIFRAVARDLRNVHGSELSR